MDHNFIVPKYVNVHWDREMERFNGTFYSVLNLGVLSGRGIAETINVPSHHLLHSTELILCVRF